VGEAAPFHPEALVVGVLSSGAANWPLARGALELEFGPLRLESPPEPFGWTDYYEAEMGPALQRRFLAFDRLVDPAALAGIKLACNRIESKTARADRAGRAINLDPGILSLGRFCLATTKNRAHRIPLSSGIYAELTLVYKGKAFQPLPWTYPDYASEAFRSLLNGWREIFAEELKGRAGDGPRRGESPLS
jgi:hypothetical protein